MKQFKSKIDRWLLVILLISIAFDLAVIGVLIFVIPEPLVLTLTILALLGAAALIASILLRTHYTVGRDTLRIVSGPFWYRVPLGEIHSVKRTRNPQSSPALSLDRLTISYGKNRRVMVSPADRRGFLRAIGHELAEE